MKMFHYSEAVNRNFIVAHHEHFLTGNEYIFMYIVIKFYGWPWTIM